MRGIVMRFPVYCLACLLGLAGINVIAEPKQEVAGYGGVLRIGLLARPGTLNPALAVSPVVTIPGAQIFASLFRLDAEFKPHAYLAQSWSLSPDGLRLRVKLVANAKFHDGKPVTSRDVAFSIRAARENNSLWGMLEAVDHVEIMDEQTLEIRLHHSSPVLFSALSVPLTPILPAHIYNDGRPLYRNPANLKPVGSGPFRFRRWEESGRLVLERFDDYFLPGLPYLERLEFDYYPVSAQIPLALAGGDIDIFSFLTRYIGAEVIQAHPELVSVDSGQAGISMPMNGLAFNLRRSPWSRPEVRRAVAGILDTRHMIDELLHGHFIPARGLFPPGSRFASEELSFRVPDVVQANRLLDKVGLYRQENGMRFGVQFLYVHGDPAMQAFVDYLRWVLGSRLGIELKPYPAVDYRQYLTRAAAGDFDIMFDVRLVWGDPLLGIHRIYHSKAILEHGIHTNYAAYANPEVDALLDAAASTTDTEQRRVCYRKLETIVSEELPYVWLSYSPLHTVKRVDLLFPTDSPRAAVQPYDQVRWIDPKRHQVSAR